MTEPGPFIAALTMPALWASLAVAFIAMVQIVRVDLLMLEISFGGCAALVLSGLAAAMLADGPSAATDSLLAGTIAAAVAALVRVLRPARLGRGDIVLLGAMGAAAGTALMPVLMVLFLLFCVVTAAAYSLHRGKRLFRSAFPAALPGMAALAPVLSWRHASSLLALPPATTAVTVLFVLAVIALVGIALLAMVQR